jgi:hypothetical protein
MAFSAPSGGIITQTGRDLNLSGLAGNAGVTRTVDDGITYYDFGTNRLYVQGTLFHDPEKEVVLFHHDALDNTFQPCLYINRTATDWGNNTAWSLAADGNLTFTRASHPFQVGDAVEIRSTNTGGTNTANNLNNIVFRVIAITSSTVTIDTNKDVPVPPSNGQSILRACYNYGNEITLYGRTRYSTGTGIYITGTSPNNFTEEGGGIYVSADGLLWARGGTIVTHRPNALSGFVNINGLSLFGTRTLDTRSMGEGVVRNFEIANVDIAAFRSVKEKGFVLKSSGLVETLSEIYYEIELRNFDASKNANDYDIGHSQNGTYCHRDWIITNSANGSNIRSLWRLSTGSSAQLGSAIVKKEVSLNVTNDANVAISGVKIYCQDNPSQYAKNVTFPDPVSGTYNAPTLSLGVLNPNGSVTYDYTQPITYAYTTDLSGSTPTFKVTTATQFLEYNTNNSAALTAYNIPSFNTTWRETDNLSPLYSDWDTDRFGGFYKVDRRSNSNTSADDFTFKFCSYGHLLSISTQALKGLDTLQVNWILFDDSSITETNKGTVDAYTTIDNPEEFYDRAKSFLYDNYIGETSTIVSRSGNTINAGSYNITVDANAASVFAFDGTTITIKASQFVGNIASSGTFTLLNGAEILGTYGAETVLPWTVTNVEAGSTIQLFNVTGDNEIENYVTGGSGKITATGSYGTTDAVAGDTIRLRVTCQVGLQALEPFETFGVATAAGISFRADQVADAVYNANNIDGSNITGITLTPDYTNIQIDLDDDEAPYQITAQEIYNYYAYVITTTQGIANFFGAISPIDRMNYRINASVAPIKLQNTGTTDVVINGGRLYRDDNVSIIDTNSASGAGTGSLVHDTGFLLQYLQPQVEAAISTVAQDTDMQLVKTDIANIKKKTNLIPGLM